MERLNDSIRTFVWSVLGAQSQTRTGILGTGTSFDAQKQFLANIEDSIASPLNIPSSIKRYQDILHYASSKVDFVFGTGLYMAPSDMLLRIGRIQGYNNEIIIATTEQGLGLNEAINPSTPLPPPARPGTGVDEDLIRPQSKGQEKPGNTPVPTTTAAEKAEAINHEDLKTALVVGAVAAGLLSLWLLHRRNL